MKQSITVAEAREVILGAIRPLGTEKVPIPEGLGRVLAETVTSPWDIPPLDNTAMDGFAVRAADVASASSDRPVALEVIEDLPAGRMAANAITAGMALRIMTGAPMPAGADAVVRVEDTRAEGTKVLVMAAVPPGEHVRRAGEDVREGEKVLEAGAVLTAAAVGMLASLGRGFVQVTQRPRVAVLSTGDELVDIDGDRRDGRIIASNTYSLAAQVRVRGLPSRSHRAGQPGVIEEVSEAMSCDVIVSSGGVSVGDYDFIKDVLESLGSEMKFWRVAMKPGHPLAFGLLGGRPAFGLPGNPVSCMVSFEQFVRPALLRMMGHRDLFRPVVRARLANAPAEARPSLVHSWIVTRERDGLAVGHGEPVERRAALDGAGQRPDRLPRRPRRAFRGEFGGGPDHRCRLLAGPRTQLLRCRPLRRSSASRGAPAPARRRSSSASSGSFAPAAMAWPRRSTIRTATQSWTPRGRTPGGTAPRARGRWCWWGRGGSPA
jgi:molybdopterin molybdotransferase